MTFAGIDRTRFRESWPVLVLGLAVLVGLGIRLYYVLRSGFPLNDGGLFYAMARDIRQADYGLPTYTSYNSEAIPFAYPPLFLYALALLDRATPLSAFDILRFLPLIASVATIPVFYSLAKELLPSKAGVAAAVLVFATIQNGFEWHIMGGGITRAPALLFSLAAILYAYRAYRGAGWRATILATVFASLALLSHPDLFVVVSVALLFVLYGRSRRGLASTAVIAGGVFVLTSPWWGTVIVRHGLDTLLATGESRTQQGWTNAIVPWRDFLTFPFTKQPLLNWPAVLAILGGCAAVASAQFLLPLWLIAEVLAEPHQAPNFVHVPVALLVGFAASAIVAPAWRSLQRTAREAAAPVVAGDATSRRGTRRREVLLWVGAGLLAAYFSTVALFSAFNEPGQLDHLKGLDGGSRDLMAWVHGNVEPGSSFLVVSGLPWWGDRISEWFPALTPTHSNFTAQGAEWLGNAFEDRIEGHDELQECGGQTVECLSRVAGAHRARFEYVYVAGGSCCSALRDSVRRAPDYAVVRESPAGLVAIHRAE